MLGADKLQSIPQSQIRSNLSNRVICHVFSGEIALSYLEAKPWRKTEPYQLVWYFPRSLCPSKIDSTCHPQQSFLNLE